MEILVLGSGAGGGFPQWNCNCPNCSGYRNGTLNITARTQSSIAISSNGEDWLLFNTSPDLLQQISQNPEMQPRAKGLRDTPIKAILYIDSQIDHTTGLLMLREGCPHLVYSTEMAYQDLTTGFPIFELLKSWNGGINHRTLGVDGEAFEIPELPGLRLRVWDVDGKAPPYSPHRHDQHRGDNIAVQIEDIKSGGKLFYAPGLNSVNDKVLDIMKTSDCLMVDGTFWTNDEMHALGLGDKMASDMGHLPQSGKNGMMEMLAPLEKQRKILIHINNSNPILNEDSPQRAELKSANIEVAYDGMKVTL
ncbi:MAG: pyrroloquinoline quinone biosynthesis protein PqqB [Pseudomonadales bacterium]|nr:pyrroloquinoline quinone biosynthesis protein PqqB [Pseudomonadales bacterium]